MSGIECAFLGALGRDAEPKTSKAGKAYLRLNVRVGDGDGAQFVSVLAFDDRAIEAGASFVKGARVYVEGRLSTSEWTDQKGEKRLSLSVISWHTRLAQIGRSKSKAYHSPRSAPANRLPSAEKPIAASADTFHDDDIWF
jgi:single-stranded DNA-binding protein